MGGFLLFVVVHGLWRAVMAKIVLQGVLLGPSRTHSIFQTYDCCCNWVMPEVRSLSIEFAAQ